MTSLVISPDALGLFVTPFQQEAVTKWNLFSLFLMAVKVITERGDVKDGLWEVHVFPKHGNYQGEIPPILSKKHPFASQSSHRNILLPLTIKRL
jgi:hypothetical protein